MLAHLLLSHIKWESQRYYQILLLFFPFFDFKFDFPLFV
jgi:hypothetical protein